MIPIRLYIKKKTIFPDSRSKVGYFVKWIPMVTILPEQSKDFIKNVSGNPSGISTEAQLACWLKQHFGLGIYLILASRKGREGFYSFWYGDCQEDGFIRIPGRKSAERREMQKLKGNYNQLNRQLKGLEDGDSDQAKLIKENIKEIEADQEFASMMSGMNDKVKRGPAPYLKSSMPLFKKHTYQDRITEEQYAEIKQQGINL